MPKRISKPRQVVSINLEKEIVDLVEKNRRDLTRSDKINSLIKSGLQYESRGQKKLYEYDWQDNYNNYTIRGSVLRLLDAMNKGQIQHYNGRWIIYALKLIQKVDYAENQDHKKSGSQQKEDLPIGNAHQKPIPYGEL